MIAKNKKLIRYTGAAGALLAVSATANAHVSYGEILQNYTPPGGIPFPYDGDAILDHHQDVVFIDMDSDGEADFVGIMFSTTDTFINTSSSTSTSTFRFVLVGSFGSGSDSGYVGLNNSFSTSSSSSFTSSAPFIKKFNVGEQIGPIDPAFNMGFLTFFSTGDGPIPPPPDSAIPPMAPFNFTGDSGFVGVGMKNGSNWNYGYIQVNINTDSESVEFISGAIETNSNKSISAGAAVPVLPIASAGAIGLIGLMAAMKKRKRKNA